MGSLTVASSVLEVVTSMTTRRMLEGPPQSHSPALGAEEGEARRTCRRAFPTPPLPCSATQPPDLSRGARKGCGGEDEGV